MRQVEYYIVGFRPVKFVPTPDGGMTVLKLNWKSGIFEYGMEYFARASSGDSDVEHVSEDQFIQHVEALRSRAVHGEGAIFALYETMNAVEDVAKGQARPLTTEERVLLAELRRQTYAMFQKAYPDDMSN